MTRAFAAAAALLMATGCGVPAQPRAEVVDERGVPFSLLDPNAPGVVPTTQAAPTQRAPLCYVADGRLKAVEQEVRAEVGLLELARSLASPPSDATGALRTALLDASLVRDVQAAGGIARVDLSQSISTLAGDEQLLAVAQLVCTLTGRPGIGLVSFTVEGTPVEVPRGDGSLVAQPVSRDDYASLLG